MPVKLDMDEKSGQLIKASEESESKEDERKIIESLKYTLKQNASKEMRWLYLSMIWCRVST